LNLPERSRILDAVFRAAREAAEVPLTAEEDGEAFTSFIVEGALRDLAEEGMFVEPVAVRAVLRALTGYGEAG
jgi:hypothetical protein